MDFTFFPQCVQWEGGALKNPEDAYEDLHWVFHPKMSRIFRSLCKFPIFLSLWSLISFIFMTELEVLIYSTCTVDKSIVLV